MKKIFIVYIVSFLLFSPAYSAMVDDSIDESIRKTYKTSEIENLLPNLPKVEPSLQYEQNDTVFTTGEKIPAKNYSELPVNNIKKEPLNNTVKIPTAQISQNYNKDYKEIKVKKGTRFKVKLQNGIADTTPRGTRVAFVSVYPETSRYVTIPAGTVFRGQVLNSHPPQLLGNGGLIELKIDELVYKRSAYHIDSKVSIANYKRIYLNNIKGRQKYLNSMTKITKPGNRFMRKMLGVSKQMNAGAAEIILVPVAIACGAVYYGVNIILSPVLSIFSTGESIKIPSGSYFEIKLTEDAIIRDY